MVIFGAIVFTLVLSVIDRRRKIVIFRRRDPRAAWQVVSVEFSARKIAEARQVEILRTWRPGALTNALPMSSEDLRRARRESK